MCVCGGGGGGGQGRGGRGQEAKEAGRPGRKCVSGGGGWGWVFDHQGTVRRSPKPGRRRYKPS